MNVLLNARTFGDVVRGHAEARSNKMAFESLHAAGTTFRELDRRINRLNHACLGLGLCKGDRAAILSRNRSEYVEVYGLAKTGVIVVPLNWRLAAAELLALLVHSAPRILFVDAQYRPLVESLRSELSFVETFVHLGDAPAGFVNYEALLAAGASDEEPKEGAQPNDPLCLLYTSGTTGAPKGVIVTHAAALGNCKSSAIGALKLSEADSAMAIMPLFHAGGMWYHLFPSFAVGCTTLILSEFEPGTVLRALAERGTSNVHLVPSMIGALLAHPDLKTFDLSGLRLLFYAASPIPEDMLRRALAALPGCDFIQCYGSTEAGVVTVLDADDHRRAAAGDASKLLRSCGRPLPDCRLRIPDRQGGAAAIGEIEVASPNVMAGYWKNAAATKAAMDDEYLRTGDLGYQDADGYVYIIDRKNDLVITGGENVFPTEVEHELFADPDIVEAAVFGVPDSVWVEKLVAAVVLRSGARVTGETLIRRLKTKLAGYKCPKEIYIRDSLPKNAVGKVLRKELRREYGEAG
jgi:long-chain acyl-CoA synthetase